MIDGSITNRRGVFPKPGNVTDPATLPVGTSKVNLGIVDDDRAVGGAIIRAASRRATSFDAPAPDA
jgi:hypothetical protein